MEQYNEENIGDVVSMNDKGITYEDEIIEIYLPNGQKIIGPSLGCGKIFARFLMIPDMINASEQIKKMIEENGV